MADDLKGVWKALLSTRGQEQLEEAVRLLKDIEDLWRIILSRLKVKGERLILLAHKEGTVDQYVGLRGYGKSWLGEKQRVWIIVRRAGTSKLPLRLPALVNRGDEWHEEVYELAKNFWEGYPGTAWRVLETIGQGIAAFAEAVREEEGAHDDLVQRWREVLDDAELSATLTLARLGR